MEATLETGPVCKPYVHSGARTLGAEKIRPEAFSPKCGLCFYTDKWTMLWALQPCSFPLYTIYKDYFFIKLLNKRSVEETP